MGAFSTILEIFNSLDITGKIIVVLLTVISIYMWGLIAGRWRYLNVIERGNLRMFKRLKEFRAQFLRDYLQLFRDFPDSSRLPLYRLYRVSCDFIFNNDTISINDFPAAEKLIDAQLGEQVNELEQGLNYLSVTATIAPFLGLLGTVWGIMISFRRMTTAGSTTISTVAPGISVALVTTVVGLIVAIPAAVAFYYFRTRINKQIVMMENFSRELIVRMQKLAEQELKE